MFSSGGRMKVKEDQREGLGPSDQMLCKFLPVGSLLFCWFVLQSRGLRMISTMEMPIDRSNFTNVLNDLFYRMSPSISVKVLRDSPNWNNFF